MTATTEAVEKVRKYVEYPYTNRDTIVLNSDLVRLTAGDLEDVLAELAAAVARAEAAEAKLAGRVKVKPLVWETTVDGAGHDHGVTSAWCPVLEKRLWAERPDKQAKIEAKRAARILAALEGQDD